MIARITKTSSLKTRGRFDRSNLDQIPTVDRETLEQTIAEIELIGNCQDAKRLRTRNRCLKVTSILFMALLIISLMRYSVYVGPKTLSHPAAKPHNPEIAKIKDRQVKATLLQFQRLFLASHPVVLLPEGLDEASLKTAIWGMSKFTIFQKLLAEVRLGLGLTPEGLAIDEFKFFVETVGKEQLLRTNNRAQEGPRSADNYPQRSNVLLCVVLGSILFAIGAILINMWYNRKLQRQVKRLRARLEHLLILQNRRLVSSSTLVSLEEDMDVLVVQVFNRIYQQEPHNGSFII